MKSKKYFNGSCEFYEPGCGTFSENPWTLLFLSDFEGSLQ